MPGKTKVFTGTYAESPLYQFVAKALEKIAEIKIKYPLDTAKTDSEERKEAQQLVHVAESALKIIHTTVLSKFDHGQTPGLFALGKMGISAIKLHSLVESLKTRETMLIHDIITLLPSYIYKAQITGAASLTDTIITILDENKRELFKDAAKISGPDIELLFAKIKSKIIALRLEEQPTPPTQEQLPSLIIDHLLIDLWIPKDPMTYETMELIADMITNAPDNIFQVVPFIDPRVAPNLLQSGLIGKLISHFGAFHLEYIESTNADTPSYAYNVTKETGSQIYNAEAYYQHRIFFLHNTLKPALRRYLAGNAISHAENVPAARSVITNAIGHMKREFARTSLLERFIDIEYQSISNDFLSYETTCISPMLVTETSQMNLIEKLNQDNKKLSLTQDLMNNLKMRLESYNIQSLATLLQKHARHLFDEAMENKALGLDVSFLHEPLPNEIHGGTGGINAIGGPSIEIKNKLTHHIVKTLEAIKGHEEQLICQITQLTNTAMFEFEQQFHRINASAEETLSAKTLSLEEIIERLSNTNQQRGQLLQTALDLIKGAQAFIPTRPETDFANVIATANRFIVTVKAHQEASNQQELLLTNQLEKTKSDACFTEILQSANPVKLQQMQALDQQQLCQLKDHKNLLIAQLRAIDANYTSKETALHAASSEECQVESLQTALEQVKASEANEMALLLQKLNDIATQISLHPAHEPDHINHLSQVKIILEAHLKTNKLPFEAIDKFMQKSLHTKKQMDGFDTLITSLDQDLNLQAYKNYRKRQDSLFQTKPSAQEFSGMYEKLLKAIDEKIRMITDNIKREHELTEEVLKIKHEIQRLDQQQQLSHERAIELLQKRSLIQLKKKEITEALAPLTEERIKISDTLEQFIAKETLLENSLRVLTEVIAILLEIDPLKSLVELIARGEDDTDLSQYLPLEGTIANLVEKTDALTPAIDTLAEPLAYQTTLAAIRQMLNAIKQRITTISEEKTARLKERTLTMEANLTSLTLENIQPITPNESVPPSDKAEKRKALIDSFILNLNTYKCDQQKRHGLFDFMITNNKTARIAFIDTMIQALLQYAHLGEADNLLALIRSKVTYFKDIDLQSRLNKITADILDFEEGILQTEAIESRQLTAQRADNFLNELNPHHAAYVASIRKLNENISAMQHYGEQLMAQGSPSGIIVTCLAEQLKKNTNHFIISHGATPPSAAVYQRFFEKFTARLHSEDHIMCKDKGSWTRIVANIAFILSWLIPKWLQPNSNHHRSSFFSNKTKDEQHRDNIETSALALEHAINEPRQRH